MADHFPYSLAWYWSHEGVHSDHHADAGGATIYGISSVNWPDAYRRVMAESCPDKARGVAMDFYRDLFWNKYLLWDLHSRYVAAMAFDILANHGPRGALVLQWGYIRASNSPLTTDGIIGPKTRAALNLASTNTNDTLILCASIAKARANYYERILESDPSQAVFCRGWLRRCVPPPGLQEEWATAQGYPYGLDV